MEVREFEMLNANQSNMFENRDKYPLHFSLAYLSPH